MYCKRILTIPLLEHLDNELNERVKESSVPVCKGYLVIIPLKMSLLVGKNVDWKEKFFVFAELYKDDFPCYKALDKELDFWQTYWLKSTNCLPDNISSTLKSKNFNGYSNIKVALRIVGTLPVTTCSCKRSFSAMRRPKTYTRSTMSSERLNGVAFMHVHQEIVPDTDKVTDLFSEKKQKAEYYLNSFIM